MKPSDSNLSIEEYIKYFADEKLSELFDEYVRNIKTHDETIYELETRIDELENDNNEYQYDNEHLANLNWNLENKIEELEEEIQILKNDMERIIGARNG